MGFYLVVYVGFVAGAIYFAKWVFGIQKISDNLDHQASLALIQKEAQEKQEKITLAQLHVLGLIADKLGVPASDINEATKELGIEFE